MPAQLGTILPTRASLQATEAYARDVASMQAATVAAAGLARFDCRREQGETRYYDGPNRYAVASHRKPGKVLWFTRKPDGWYAEPGNA